MVSALKARHHVQGVAKSKGTSDFSADISDNEMLSQIINVVKPDFVVNAVKPPLSTDEMEVKRELARLLNVTLVENLIELQKEAGFCLVQLSSDWLYEGKEGQTYDENSQTVAKNFYTKTKLDAESRIACSGMPYLILRTEGVFGHDSRGGNTLARLRASGRVKKPFFAASDQFSQPICGIELARLFCTLAENGANGIFNAVGKDYISRFELAHRLASFFSIDVEVRPFSIKERSLQLPQYIKVDTSKIESIAGAIKSLNAQLADFRDWENGRKI